MADLADCLQAGCSVLGALAVLAIMVVLILDVFLAEDDIKSGPAHLRPDATDDSGHVCGAGRLRDRGVGAPDCGGRPS